MLSPFYLWSLTMLKIRILAIAAAFGLVALVGCGPVPSTGSLKDKAKDAVDKGVDKAKEVGGDIKDKTKEVVDKGVDKAKEGWDKIKDTVGKWKDGYDKDLTAVEAKVKELDAKKAAAKSPAEIQKAEAEFKEANGMLEQVKVAVVGSFDKVKDGTAWDDFKKNVEPKMAALKEKLGIK